MMNKLFWNNNLFNINILKYEYVANFCQPHSFHLFGNINLSKY